MQDPVFVQQAFAEIAPRYVLANHVLSLGIDLVWRRRAAQLAAACAPRIVLDVATGSGDLAAAVGRACPKATVIGVDFSVPMLRRARKRGLAELVVADALQMPFADGTFDVVTVGFGLRNMANYSLAVREMSRVLKLGGRLILLDFSLPRGFWRRPYQFYLHRLMPRLAGLLTGKSTAYEYLGGSIESFPSDQAMTRLLEENGFAAARHFVLTGGIAALYVASASQLDGAAPIL
ncbi:MAG: ubiquinone/menaquinone biosynthesis methyltransferase [Verrucomicrobiales bacterium]